MTETSSTDTTRPITHDDLPDYARQGHLVALIPGDYLTRYPSLGQHLLAAIAEAERLGLRHTSDGRIEIPRTEVELDKALEQAQRSWDMDKERYEQALVNPASIEQTYWRGSVDRWAKAEGREPITWPTEQVSA